MAQERGQPFEPGNKIGRGRPKGSRNKNRLMLEGLLMERAVALINKCMLMAMQGDLQAMRMWMDRVLPVRRDGYVQLPLPSTKLITDVSEAGRRVVKAMASGKITPDEAEKMSNTLESRRRVMETEDLLARVEKLEAVTTSKNRHAAGVNGAASRAMANDKEKNRS
jgi:hypothetical protein